MSRTAILVGSLVMVVGLSLSGCQSATQPAQSGKAPAVDQKQGDTTKTGSISQAGSQFFLNVTGSQPLAIDSYAIDLGQYVGKTVTVTGQYSGDTLFVGKIQ